jgi:hypothetical protein
MEKTLYVQRLKEPKEYADPFSPFGGGLKNGGIPQKAFDKISQIWSFDYMGSASFEHGAVPEALQNIADYTKAGKAITGQVELEKSVFYLCEKDMKKSVEDTIRNIAKDDRRLSEPTYLKEVIEGNKGFEKYKGWLELNNGFMFFVSQEMFMNSVLFFAPLSSKKRNYK